MEIESIEITCHCSPAQLEGKTDTGLFIYARARYSRAVVSVAETFEEAVRGAGPYDLSCIFSNDLYASSTPERLMELTKAFVAMIE